MDRYWLLTSTFYGNWLPGDARGFVARVRDERPGDPQTPARLRHNMPGTPYDEDIPGLHGAAEEELKGEPILVNLEQARALLTQFQETSVVRGWGVLAVAVMANHVHLVVGVSGDPSPKKVLGDFKAYGSRALTKGWGRPASETWWTSRGSKRKLVGRRAVVGGVEYVRGQFNPLIVWINPQLEDLSGQRT